MAQEIYPPDAGEIFEYKIETSFCIIFPGQVDMIKCQGK
jgi:hypothetical protein